MHCNLREAVLNKFIYAYIEDILITSWKLNIADISHVNVRRFL
jgi:hypothetical protein